jgi:hypothetical protein
LKKSRIFAKLNRISFMKASLNISSDQFVLNALRYLQLAEKGQEVHINNGHNVFFSLRRENVLTEAERSAVRQSEQQEAEGRYKDFHSKDSLKQFLDTL